MPHRTAACGERAGSDRHAHPQLTRKGLLAASCASAEKRLCADAAALHGHTAHAASGGNKERTEKPHRMAVFGDLKKR